MIPLTTETDSISQPFFWGFGGDGGERAVADCVFLNIKYLVFWGQRGVLTKRDGLNSPPLGEKSGFTIWLPLFQDCSLEKIFLNILDLNFFLDSSYCVHSIHARLFHVKSECHLAIKVTMFFTNVFFLTSWCMPLLYLLYFLYLWKRAILKCTNSLYKYTIN